MREFERAQEPPELQSSAASLTEEWLRRVAESERGRPAQWTWGPRSGGKTVRDHILPVLMGQTDHHCSYCDLYPVTPGSRDTVDHFHPKEKDKRPDLAFAWDNLFYACDACQSEKRAQPCDDVLKPDVGGYRWQRYFRYNTETGALLPKDGISEEDKGKARATIAMFGLNRRGRPRARRRAYRDWHKLGRPAARWRPYRFCLVPESGA